MAPLTRARRRRDSVPLIPSLENPNSPLRPSPRSSRHHDDNETSTLHHDDSQSAFRSTPTPEETGIQVNGTSEPRESNWTPELEETNGSSELEGANSPSNSDSDDEAPEAVSLETGRETARKLEQEAKRATEAYPSPHPSSIPARSKTNPIAPSQEKAARKKRKDRDTKLKEQKSEAAKRKRGKVTPAEADNVDESKSLTRHVATASEKEARVEEKGEMELAKEDRGKESRSAPKELIVPLLPESLLAQVSALPNRQMSSDSDSDSGAVVEIGQKQSLIKSGKLEKNRRKRERRKLNKTFRRGPVNVKVLEDKSASRRILPPPAAKIVGSIKDAWLFRQRKGIERRSFGGGFVR